MCQYRCLHVCLLREGDTWICVFTVCDTDGKLHRRTDVPAHYVNIDRQQVSQCQTKKDWIKRDISLCPRFVEIQSAGNQTWWISDIVKTKNQSFSNSHVCITTKSWDFGQRCNFQSHTHLSNLATAHFPCHTKTPIYLSLFMSTWLLSTTASYLLTLVFPVSPQVIRLPKKKM